MITNNLKNYINEKGISMQHIHEKTGIRYATILNIINGNNKRVNIDYLAAIMDAINISDFNLVFKKKSKDK